MQKNDELENNGLHPCVTRLPVAVLLLLNIGEGVLVDVNIPQVNYAQYRSLPFDVQKLRFREAMGS